MNLHVRVELQHGEKLLVKRAGELRARLEAEPALWPDYMDAVRTLAAIAPAVAPEASGRLLRTEEMAERLGMSAKTLLRHKTSGKITPAVSRGKCIRWTGRETL